LAFLKKKSAVSLLNLGTVSGGKYIYVAKTKAPYKALIKF